MRNRGTVIVSLACLVVVLAGVTASTLMIGDRTSGFTWYVLGAGHATCVVLVGAMLYTTFLVHDRRALWQLRGAWGEDATKDVLAKAQRKRIVWGWVDGLRVEGGDLDHFVVTRRGGLVVLDSKFRTDDDASVAATLAAGAVRVRTRAEGLARSHLPGSARGRRRGRGKPFTVRPAVVVWGPLQHEVPVQTHEGVDVVPGRGLLDWLSSLDGDEVSEEAAYDLLVQLNDRRRGPRT